MEVFDIVLICIYKLFDYDEVNYGIELFWFTETLAMKGLTLNCMDSKNEAYELVRKGLKVVNHPHIHFTSVQS
mgnify:FL=1